MREVSMQTLWPFITHRREIDGVKDATINRTLEIVRRILHLARDEWDWLERFPKIRLFREPKRRIRFLRIEEADRLLEELPAHLVPVAQFSLATGTRMGETLRME